MSLLTKRLEDAQRVLGILQRADSTYERVRHPRRALRSLDRKTTQAAVALRRPGVDTGAKVATWGGSWVTHVVVLGLAAHEARREDDPWTFATAATQMLGASAVSGLLKVAVGRSRPAVQHLVGTRDSSFPSGHTVTAAAAARTLADLYDAPRLPLAALAVGVGWTRVHLGVHYLTDVVAGFAQGWSWASAVSRFMPGVRRAVEDRVAAHAPDPPVRLPA